MKALRVFAFSSISCIALTVSLTGCSGATAFPDTAEQTSPGAIKGSVFGGHAPIVGAHVYVLEAGQTGYASAAVSKLTTGAGTDSIGTYVVTDGLGNFNITGDYTCDVNHPVYLAAAGGSTLGSNITITAAVATPVLTSYSITFTAANTLATGNTVTFSGLNGNYTGLNGLTETVTAATTTTFSVLVSGVTVSGTATGTATPNVNAAIVNMAVLGLCPSTPHLFADNLSFVYMNEVSTVAAAYAFAGFGTGPYNVGSSSTNLVGIQNAVSNAAALYDITGHFQSTTSNGEGHIARPTTPGGNGIVPQSTLDTLGNILAACVDSSGATSANCNVLFQTATASGALFGTAATNTATAAFNIAHFPAGTNNANFTTTLNNLPTGVQPFSPNLGAAPNDFTIGIAYKQAATGGATANSFLGDPESIAIDSVGNVWETNATSNHVVKLLPTGVLSFDSGAYSTAPGYVSVDPSNNAWFGYINGGSVGYVTKLTSAGAATNYDTGLSTVSSSTTDNAGNAYFITAVGTGGTASLFKVTPGTTPTYTTFSGSNTCVPGQAGYAGYDHLAIDATSAVWSTEEHNGILCRFTTGGAAATGFPITLGANTYYPEVIGIDSAGTAWITVEKQNEVDEITINATTGAPTQTLLTSGSTGATFNQPFSSAIDGAGHVWITNRGSASITELSNGGTAISPAANYKVGGLLNDPLNAAVDPSGDVWITNYAGNEIVELVGAATPTATPLSAGNLGVTP